MRVTKQDLEQQLRSARQDYELASQGLQAAIVGEITWLPNPRRWENETYRFGHFNLGSPTGGYVVITSTVHGQRPYTIIRYLDDMRAELIAGTTWYTVAAEPIHEILRERNRMLATPQVGAASAKT